MADGVAEKDGQLHGFLLFLLLVGSSLATFIYVLDYSIANVAIPYIAGSLAVGADQGTYVITSFAVGNAISLSMTGWFTKRVGMVRLMLISIALFTLFSMLCGFSTTIVMLVVFRFIQGFVVGPVIPLSQSMLMQHFPEKTRTIAIALWSMIVLVAPVAGPVVGGWICVYYTWPWIFFINLPIGITAMAFLYIALSGQESAIVKERFDWVGFILLAIGVTCLQVFLDKGEEWDWFGSIRIRVLSVTALICLIYLTIWSLNYERPLLELKLLKIRTFWISIFVLFFGYSLYFGTVVLIPLWLQTFMGYDAYWAGIAVCSIGFAPIVLGPFLGKIINKVGYISAIVFAYVFFAISCFLTAYMNPQVDMRHILYTRFILGIGVAFWVTPLFAMSLIDVPKEKMASGAGIFHFIRALSGGIGTSVYTTIWYRRIRHHHLNLTADISPYKQLAAEYFDSLKQFGIAGKKALNGVNLLVTKQASVLAINEAFYVMGWVSVVLIFFVLFAIKRKRQKTAFDPHKSAAGHG